jgi:Polyketide cyclase / dehydrase and lipid transport
MKYLLAVAAILFSFNNTKAQSKMTTTVTKTMNIKASPDKVWEFVNDLSLWPKWAIYNVLSSKQGDGGYWLMEGPRGTSKVKMNSNKATGILDHDFIDPGEGHWKVPCRVVAGYSGSHFMITFTKPEQMPDEAFEVGMKLLDEELVKLKEYVETN